MKKTKIIALILVIAMLALSMPVYAQYDPTIRPKGGPPKDTYTVVSVYHWVVRGESLQNIVDMYGTNIEEIKFYNEDYFKDLANRNKTTGLDIQVEHGVRLFIYHMLRVEHYVQRGDTLSGLANGQFKTGSFTLYTTEAAIIAENKAWFDSKDRLNTTRNTAHVLEESYDLWNVRYKDIGDYVHGPGGNDNYSKEYGRTVDAGAPLYISVPVQIKVDRDEPLYPSPELIDPVRRRETYEIVRLYDGINGEHTGRPNLLETVVNQPIYSIVEGGYEIEKDGISKWVPFLNGPQIPFPNTLPTNMVPEKTERWIGYPFPQNLRLTAYKIPGWAGALAEKDGGTGIWY